MAALVWCRRGGGSQRLTMTRHWAKSWKGSKTLSASFTPLLLWCLLARSNSLSLTLLLCPSLSRSLSISFPLSLLSLRACSLSRALSRSVSFFLYASGYNQLDKRKLTFLSLSLSRARSRSLSLSLSFCVFLYAGDYNKLDREAGPAARRRAPHGA